MDFAVRILAAIWDWIAWYGRALWTGVIALVQTVWGKWLIVVGWAWAVVEYGAQLLSDMVGMIGSTIFSAFDLTMPAGLSSLMATTNYLFPLTELIVLTVAYLTVQVLMAVYRHYKSYVPGAVSGGT